MEGYLLQTLLALAILQLLGHFSTCTATIVPFPSQTSTQLIRTTCNVGFHEHLCYNSLKIYADKIQNDHKVLAHTALNVTFEFAKQTYANTKRLSAIHGLGPKVTVAFLDCVKGIGVAVEKLQKSVDEFGRLVEGTDFGVQIGSIKALVGDAHENVNTCLDPLGESYQTGKLVQVGHRHIKKFLFLTEISSLTIREYEYYHNNPTTKSPSP